MEWLAARVTDVFLTVSEAEAARRPPPAHQPRMPIAVGNGRDPAIFHPDPAARARIRAELGVPTDRVVVIAVSRLVRHKGYPELAAAMRDVPEAELWVVGERLASDRGEDMAALLQAAGLGDRLRLLGYREDVPALLAAADIFALPSHFEGLPMSVIEAMLTGLPVVATDIARPARAGGARRNRPAGAPAMRPLGAALRRLPRDPALRATMGAGRPRARAGAATTRRKSSARTAGPARPVGLSRRSSACTANTRRHSHARR